MLDLKSFVDYEAHQIVTLTIANQPAVGVTLFALDEGSKLDTHVAHGDTFPNVLEGEAEFTVGDKHYRVRAGESIVMPVGVPHSVKAITKCKMLLVLKNPE